MKTYKVRIALIIGYYNDESPKLKNETYTVQADSEKEAIEKAKVLDTSLLSVWDIDATEI
jgi:hypothetical protein